MDTRTFLKTTAAANTMTLWMAAARRLDAARRNAWIARLLGTLCAAASFWNGFGWWLLPVWVALVALVEHDRRRLHTRYLQYWQDMVEIVGEGAFASLRALYLPYHQPELDTKADARLGRWLRRALKRGR